VSDTWSLAKVVRKVEFKLLQNDRVFTHTRKRQINELKYLFFNTLSETIIFQNFSHFQYNVQKTLDLYHYEAAFESVTQLFKIQRSHPNVSHNLLFYKDITDKSIFVKDLQGRNR
jgi:hypothetical protein